MKQRLRRSLAHMAREGKGKGFETENQEVLSIYVYEERERGTDLKQRLLRS